MKNTTKNHEQGVVSLLTVMFFMVFISLIVMGFLSLVVNDQRQTTDSDLSASALAAAQSGVEDGKRILLFCQTNPSDPNCVPSVLNSIDNCDVFKSGPGASLASSLAIPIDSGTGQGVTGGASQYQQYFSCLTIQQDTPYVTAPVNAGNGYIQKLQTTQPFNRLTVSWSGNGTFADRTTIGSWPTVGNWKDASSKAYAPVIQLQIIPYKASDFSNLDTIEHQSKIIYIAPCTLSAGVLPGACNTSTDINTLDQRGVTGQARLGGIPLTYAGCTTTGTQGYECSTMLTGFNGGGPSPQQYYVRASVLYAAGTTLKLSPSDGLGNAVTFDNVQPWIDVTGRTNDVFRRVRAQISYTSIPPLPQYVIDSAAPVCKDMTVTADANSSYNCN